MTLSSQYSTEQMYSEWINGTPISEIVEKTGIKRKTWNKRFERYEKQFETAAVNNRQVTNGDKSLISPRNAANKFLAALAAIAFILAAYFIYLEIRKRRENL